MESQSAQGDQAKRFREEALAPRSTTNESLSDSGDPNDDDLFMPLAREKRLYDHIKLPTSLLYPDVGVSSDLYLPLATTLKVIRLLYLQPSSNPSTPIHCTLRNFNLELLPQLQQFEALSYEWGPVPKEGQTSTTKQISLSRQESDATCLFPVRENLFLALQRLRSPTDLRVMWIDALCIDQDNIQERSHQVGLMSMIYSKASKVQVWLGPADKEDYRSFDLLERITAKMRELRSKQRPRKLEGEPLCRLVDPDLKYDREEINEEPDTLPAPLATQSHASIFNSLFPMWVTTSPATANKSQITAHGKERHVGEENKHVSDYEHRDIGETLAAWFVGKDWSQIDTEWRHLRAFLNRSYWTRIWIVQEFVLGQNLILHCGSQSMSWDNFSMSMEAIRLFKPEKHYDTLKYFMDSTINDVTRVNNSVGAKIALMRRKAVQGGKHTLLELFESTKHSQCCDPRDRVYALLGLAIDVQEESIVVDYTKSPFAVQVDVMAFFRSQPPQMIVADQDLTYISSLLVKMLHAD